MSNGLNFNPISPSVPKIKDLDRQTDGQKSDLIRVPLFLKKYGILKILSFLFMYILIYVLFKK